MENNHSVDLSTVVCREFREESRTLTFDPPLYLTPSLDEDDKQSYVLENTQFGISVFASTREELIELLREQIFFLWDAYGQDSFDNEKFTENARILRQELRSRLSEQ